MIFTWPLTIYTEDTDAGGIVYHANYLKFFERARTEWLENKNLNLTNLKQQGILFVVHKASLEYKRPLFLGNKIIIDTDLIKVGRARLFFEQKIFRSNDRTDLICCGQIDIACIGENLRPKILPESILEELLRDK